jgi:hypothetical protein
VSAPLFGCRRRVPGPSGHTFRCAVATIFPVRHVIGKVWGILCGLRNLEYKQHKVSTCQINPQDRSQEPRQLQLNMQKVRSKSFDGEYSCQNPKLTRSPELTNVISGQTLRFVM